MAYCIENFFEDMSTKDSKTKFILPAIQRGFVWKAYQIENFWDSLARSFPIGSFIVKENIHNDNHEVHILDGQQRASAILIGMTGAKDDSPFNIANNRMRLFIDLEDPCFTREENENEETIIEKRFVFRCITRSHPWGYQKNKNSETLETKDIRYALEYLENNKIIGEKEFYSEVKTETFCQFIPYDCMVSLPVDKIFSAKDKNDFISEVQEYLKDIYNDFISIDNAGNIKIKSISKEINLEDMDIPTKGLRVFLEKKLKQLTDKKYKDEVKAPIFFNLGTIYDRLVAIKQYGLTFCTLDNSPIKFDKQENLNSVYQQNKITDEDVETVFYRINMGGTRLTEDDLNYSLFKSCMKDTNLIKNFEKACAGILEPAKAFKLAYLLYSYKPVKETKKSDKNEFKSYLPAKVNFKVSYLNIKKACNEKAFISYIQENFINENILLVYKNIMLYSKENKNGLPYPLFNKFGKSGIELVFVLLYRLLGHDKKYIIEQTMDKEPTISEDQRKVVIGYLFGLFNLFKGDTKTNYKKLVNHIMPIMVLYKDFEDCWSIKLFERANQMYPYDELAYIVQKPSEILDDNGLIMWNTDWLLYAQREYLSVWFENQEFSLEDSERPFDFDHIFPYSLRSSRGFNYSLRSEDYLNRIGNFRAWPYELNRSDQDKNLHDKFDVTNYNDVIKRKIEKRLTPIMNKNIKAMLKDFSLLSKDWFELDKELLEDEENGKKYTDKLCKKTNDAKYVVKLKTLIDNRTEKIYNEWYKLNSDFKKIPDEINIKNIIEKISKVIQKKNVEVYNNIDITIDKKEKNISSLYFLLEENRILLSCNDEEYAFTLLSTADSSIELLADEIIRYYEEMIK